MREIDFISMQEYKRQQKEKKNQKIDFIHCEVAQRAMRSLDHSDLNELKSYLKPRQERWR